MKIVITIFIKMGSNQTKTNKCICGNEKVTKLLCSSCSAILKAKGSLRICNCGSIIDSDYCMRCYDKCECGNI